MIVAVYYGITLVVLVSICLSIRSSIRPISMSVRPSEFSFTDYNLSKCQWIFTKLGVCIDIVEIWFWIVMGKFCQFLTELSACNRSVFSFTDDNLSKCQWIFTKLSVCIDIIEIYFGIADGQILSIFDRVICPQHVRIFIYGR